MWVNLFEADDYDEEAQVKVVVSLTVGDLLKQIKQGEALATEWLTSRGYDAEFRVIVEGRRIGVGKNGGLTDLRDAPRIIVPGS